MMVFPLRRSVELQTATASSRVEMLSMFVRSRPSCTRWTISLSRDESTSEIVIEERNQIIDENLPVPNRVSDIHVLACYDCETTRQRYRRE